MTHSLTHVSTSFELDHRARCSCNWRSPWEDSRVRCLLSWRLHSRTADLAVAS